MTSRTESSRHVIRVNATSIDVTSSNAISFGYVNELARAGRVIAGRYRLLGPLRGKQAATSHGSLWRGESLALGKAVLVELLDPAIAEDPQLVDLFLEEAGAAIAVNSPFLNRVLDFGVELTTPYLVTECVSAEPGVTELGGVATLADRLAAKQRPTGKELSRITQHVAQALDAMHAAELLHRDLRADRIQLAVARGGAAADHQVAKLSFSISKLMNDTLELVRTMAQRASGPAVSQSYASPEQILGAAPLGPPSDLWSLAVLVFECVTGQLPFAGATLAERLVQICAGAPRVPSTLCAVPAGFDGWFARGVRKSPSERWPSARAMADALAAIL